MEHSDISMPGQERDTGVNWPKGEIKTDRLENEQGASGRTPTVVVSGRLMPWLHAGPAGWA